MRRSLDLLLPAILSHALGTLSKHERTHARTHQRYDEERKLVVSEGGRVVCGRPLLTNVQVSLSDRYTPTDAMAAVENLPANVQAAGTPLQPPWPVELLEGCCFFDFREAAAGCCVYTPVCHSGPGSHVWHTAARMRVMKSELDWQHRLKRS